MDNIVEILLILAIAILENSREYTSYVLTNANANLPMPMTNK